MVGGGGSARCPHIARWPKPHSRASDPPPAGCRPLPGTACAVRGVRYVIKRPECPYSGVGDLYVPVCMFDFF